MQQRCWGGRATTDAWADDRVTDAKPVARAGGGVGGRLPLTLTFRDYNTVEKAARLDPGLTMDGMPPGDDPSAGEIGWYAPTQDLVLYYDDVSYWTGIARLGAFDAGAIGLLAGDSHDVSV